MSDLTKLDPGVTWKCAQLQQCNKSSIQLRLSRLPSHHTDGVPKSTRQRYQTLILSRRKLNNKEENEPYLGLPTCARGFFAVLVGQSNRKV